jgi:penicillin-binding protein 1A
MTDTAEPANLRMTLTRKGSAAFDVVRGVWTNKWGRRLIYAAVVVLVGYTAFWFAFARGLPDASALLKYEPPLPTNIRSIDGTPVYSYARERRVQLSYDEYPPLLVKAYLAAEDRTFFEHGGVDYPGIVSAFIGNLTRQGRPVGASTITQQVAKNLLIGDEVTYSRKLKEALLAYRIEAALTKQQIMELYLNQIALGRNAFGVQSAALAYFGKDASALTLPEMAYLAILPKGPSNYRPERFYDRAMARRNWVLGEMLRNNFIDQAQHAAAVATPLGTIPRVTVKDTIVGGYFTEEVRRQLIEKFGENANDGPYSVYSGGLWVRTSIDPRLQGFAETALREGLLRFDRGRGWSGPVGKVDVAGNWQQAFAASNIGISYKDWRTAVVLGKADNLIELGFVDGTTGRMPSWAASMPRRGGGAAFNWLNPGDVIAVAPEGSAWSLRSVPEISGGFVAQNPHTGQIVAMQGGFDARLGSFNRATQALRQPGSSFKPFVYAAALDNGMTPASIIVDGPFCVYQGAALGRKCFRNFGGGGGSGPQTMRWGLEQSRNLMTVRAASQTGMDKVVKLAGALGISPPGRTYQSVLAVALGSGETTVARMVNAYSILANNGRATTPTVIDFVQDRNGKVVLRADTRPCERCTMAQYDGKPMPRPPSRTKQVMDAMTAYQMVHITEGVIQRGTATVLRDLNRPVFGKTGTTTGPKDVWFVGGSADIVAGVYLGYDRPRSMGGGAQGGVIAAPIFKAFAKPAFEGMPIVPFRAPAGIRMVRIDRRSGRRVYGSWPTDADPKAGVIWEAFKPESEPRRSIRNDQLPVVAVARKAAPKAQTQSRPDSDFLQRQGGIY